MSTVLVADVGGTNARFALAQPSSGRWALAHARHLRVAEHPDFESAIHAYLLELDAAQRPQRAVLAVASAVNQDRIEFTNSPWSFSQRGLRSHLGLQGLQVINDFAAVAWALPWLEAGDVQRIGAVGDPLPIADGTYAALGPGTGLGVAALRVAGETHTVLETEGGHLAFAPADAFEAQLLAALAPRWPRVSYERLLCGSGLLNLMQARALVAGRATEFDSPEAVTAAARAGDAEAREGVTQFCAMLGAFAGDAALMFGAWQGVFLCGGLLPHVLDEGNLAVLRQRFEAKGRFSHLLQRTPLHWVRREDIGQLGAAGFAQRHPAPKLSHQG